MSPTRRANSRALWPVLLTMGVALGSTLGCRPRVSSSLPPVSDPTPSAAGAQQAPAVFIEAPESAEPGARQNPASDPVQRDPQAQPEVDADPDPEARKRELAAKIRYQAGLECFEQGDIACALGHFETAHSLLPMPSMQYNIAHCHERLQDFVQACAAYAQVAASNDYDIGAAATEAMQRLGC